MTQLDYGAKYAMHVYIQFNWIMPWMCLTRMSLEYDPLKSLDQWSILGHVKRLVFR